MSVDFNPSNLRRKSILRDTNGNIINWLDETDGGWIIRNRQIVNHERWNAILQKEADRKNAAQAAANEVTASKEAIALRTGNGKIETTNEKIDKPELDKVDELEKKFNSMDDKLNIILKAINKNG